MNQYLTNLINQRNKEEALRQIFADRPVLWRMLASQFRDNLFVEDKEIFNFFKFSGIKKIEDDDPVLFVIKNIGKFQELNIEKGIKHRQKSDEETESQYLALTFEFKKKVASKVRYKIYFDLFYGLNREQAGWITKFLLNRIPKEVGITEAMMNKIEKEVFQMEIKEDAVLNITVMNKKTNQRVDMDFVMKAETLNSIMRDKVHKEFSNIFKDTCDKLNTIKNMNRLLYEP